MTLAQQNRALPMALSGIVGKEELHWVSWSAKGCDIGSACLRGGLMQRQAEPANGDGFLKTLSEPWDPLSLTLDFGVRIAFLVILTDAVTEPVGSSNS